MGKASAVLVTLLSEHFTGKLGPGKLARKLSAIARKSPSWSAHYIKQAANGKIEISKKLSAATVKLNRQMSGLRPAVSGTWVPWKDKQEQRRVLSQLDGDERRHALIMYLELKPHLLREDLYSLYGVPVLPAKTK